MTDYSGIITAINERHSVRQYLPKRIEADKLEQLNAFIDSCNQEGNLHLQLFEDAANIYNKLFNKAVGLGSAPSVILCVGPCDDTLEQRIGYYGEKLVLYAQQLGLNTCWAGIFNKDAGMARIDEGEKLVISIAIGYGKTQGRERKSKTPSQVAVTTSGDAPEWFSYGVELALKAPTAINQQKFEFRLNEDDTVDFIDKGGVFSQVDLGIVRYHFEVGKEAVLNGQHQG